MSSYFARLVQPASPASAKLSPGAVTSLAKSTEHANSTDAVLSEVDLLLEFEHPENAVFNSGVRPSSVAAAYPAPSGDSDERNARSNAIELAGLTRNQVTTSVPGMPGTALPSVTLPKPSETDRGGVTRLPEPAELVQPALNSGNAAERDVIRKVSLGDTKSRSTSNQVPLLDAVLSWIATEPQSVANPTLADDKSKSSTLNMRPESRPADPEDLPAQLPKGHPAAPVQANRRLTLSPDSHPSGFHPLGAVKTAGGELQVEEVVRIAIGEIRVRVEPPQETQRGMPAEVPPATPIRHLSDSDAASSFTVGGSLRRRCIHL